jgi:hypothetical protein
MRDNKRGTIEDPIATAALRLALRARREAASQATRDAAATTVLRESTRWPS